MVGQCEGKECLPLAGGSSSVACNLLAASFSTLCLQGCHRGHLDLRTAVRPALGEQGLDLLLLTVTDGGSDSV